MRLVIGLAAFATILFVLLNAASWLVVEDELSPADVCMSMSGRDERFEKTIEIYHRSLCKKIVIIGGGKAGELSYPARMAQLAEGQGVAKDDIVMDEMAVFSSFAELRRLHDVLQTFPDPVVDLIVVTDAYHTRRIRYASGWIFDEPVTIKLVAVHAAGLPLDSKWWLHRYPRKKVFIENFKLVYYYFAYRVPFGPLNKWLQGFELYND